MGASSFPANFSAAKRRKAFSVCGAWRGEAPAFGGANSTRGGGGVGGSPGRGGGGELCSEGFLQHAGRISGEME